MWKPGQVMSGELGASAPGARAKGFPSKTPHNFFIVGLIIIILKYTSLLIIVLYTMYILAALAVNT